VANFQDRVVGALKGQASTFAEVKADPAALSQSALIVLVSGIARAIGLVMSPFVVFGVMMAAGAAITSVVGWAIGCVVLWAVGTKVIPGRNTQVDIVTVMRTTGFAFVPLIAMVLAYLPVFGGLIGLAAGLWSLYLMVLATRVVFDYPDWVKAAVVLIIAAVIVSVAIIILGVIFATLGMAGLFVLGR
jgi:hypothetical protein